MLFKWSTETFRKTETLSNGEAHDYSGERYWIDIISTGNIHMDVVLKKVSKDNGAPSVTGRLRVNGMVIEEWSSSTIPEAAATGEKIIQDIQKDIEVIA